MKIVLLLFMSMNACLAFSQTIYMKVYKNNGTSELFPIQEIRKLTFDGLTGINNPRQLQNVVKAFNMLKNYPNPFSSSTKIEYSLSETGNVEIIIFDINGRIIRNLFNKNQISGTYNCIWDSKDNSGKSIQSGIYICNVKFKNQILNTKMLLIK